MLWFEETDAFRYSNRIRTSCPFREQSIPFRGGHARKDNLKVDLSVFSVVLSEESDGIRTVMGKIISVGTDAPSIRAGLKRDRTKGTDRGRV